MTYWSIWWRVFAWTAVGAGGVALVALVACTIPAPAWPWIGLAALALLAVSYVSFLVWIDKGPHS